MRLRKLATPQLYFVLLLATASAATAVSAEPCETGFLRMAFRRFTTVSAPGVHVFQTRLGELDAQVLRSVKKEGQQVPYVIDTDGHFHTLPEASLGELQGRMNGIEDGKRRILVREAGMISYDSENARIYFDPSYRMDPSLPENATAFQELRRKKGWERAEYVKGPEDKESLVLSCMDLLNKQAEGKGFVLNKIIGSVGITALGLAVTEPFAHRLETQAGRTVAETDLASSIATGTLFAALGSYLVKNSVPTNTATLARFATSGGVILLQNQIYSHALQGPGGDSPEEAKKKANEISAYDAGYTLFRSWTAQKIDQHFLETLPYKFYDQCRQNPGRKSLLVLAPGSIRLMESGAAALVYFGGRSALTGQ